MSLDPSSTQMAETLPDEYEHELIVGYSHALRCKELFLKISKVSGPGL
jgi:hypothetical protein